jgi:hypothetical protein
VEFVAIGLIAIVAVVVGARVGILVARRMDRWQSNGDERQRDEPDERS